MDREDMIFHLVKSLDEKQDEQIKTLTRVEADLKYHIKRTDLLEDKVVVKMNKPTLKQVGVFLGIIGTIIGALASLGII
jgi:hypothetical protein